MNVTNSCLLIVLSGKPERLRERLSGQFTLVEMLQLQEKSLVRFRNMLSLLRRNRVNAVVFGCQEVGLQRYQFILKSYLLLAKSSQGFIVDELGGIIRINPLGYFVIDVPKFFYELVASFIILLGVYIRLSFLRRLTARKRTFPI